MSVPGRFLALSAGTTRSTRRRATAVAAALLLSSGCSGAGSPSASRQERDSAGVSIVEYGAIPSAPERWAVSPKPELVIGSAMGTGADVFTAVKAVVRRSDGVLVVADVGTDEILAFDPAGRHLWTAGGKGGGPGQFHSIDALFAMAGDSVLAFDRALGRVSVFDPSGAVIRTYRMEAPAQSEYLSRVLGVTAAGTVVASGVDGTSSRSMPKSGTHWTPGRVAWYGPTGTRLATTDATFGMGFAVHTYPNGSYMSGPLPYNRRTEAAARDSEVDVTNQTRFEIQRYDERGRLAAILRVQAPPTLVDDAVRRRLLSPPPGVKVSRRLPAQKDIAWMFPDTLPALGAVRLDARGRLWVEDFLSQYGKKEVSWWVFDRRSRLVADATVPAGFTVDQIDSDRVVGVVRDSLGVSYVQVRSIEREGE